MRRFLFNKICIMFECYDNIIGLTQRDCACLATNRPQDYNLSHSGLYVDELQALSGLVGLDCDTDIWTTLQDARNTAIKQFVADSNGLLGNTYKLRRKPFNGVAGTVKERDTVSVPLPFIVIRVMPAHVRSGVIKIKAVNMMYNATGTITAELHDSVNGFLQAFTFNTSANRMHRNAVDIELEMFSKYDKKLEYFFVFNKNPNNLPKDTRTNCGCGNGNFIFSRNAPYFNSGAHPDEGWADWCQIGGNVVLDINELDNLPNDSSDKTYGIAFEMETACKVHEVLCKEGGFSSLDFQSNPSALSLAFCILYKTAVFGIEAILRSETLSRSNMMNADQLSKDAADFEIKYHEHLQYIVTNAQITGNDCLACKEGLFQLTRSGLFS